MGHMKVVFYDTEENQEVPFYYVESFSYCEDENTYELYYRHPRTNSGYKEKKLGADDYMFMYAEQCEY